MQHRFGLVVLLYASASSLVFADDQPAVTPYRPTVSNPAALSQPGWLEMESGWINNTLNDQTTRGSLPYTLKFAFTDNLGVLLGGEAFIDQTDTGGTHFSGSGDTLLLLKHRWATDNETALGLEYGFKMPTAKTDLGSGKTDYLVNAIYSTQRTDNTIDLNLNLTQLGAVADGESAQQWGWAATWSRPLNDVWGIAAELSGYARQGSDPASQFLTALSYASSRRVVWDAGLASGLNQAAPKWSLFAGVSVLLGKL